MKIKVNLGGQTDIVYDSSKYSRKQKKIVEKEDVNTHKKDIKNEIVTPIDRSKDSAIRKKIVLGQI